MVGEGSKGGGASQSNPYVLDFSALDATQVAVAGGKGARLGELMRVEGLRVPQGFCVTTAAFSRAVMEDRAVDDLLGRLDTDDDGAGAELRRTVEGLTTPGDVATAIAEALARLGADDAYAVRSSATVEDSPTASFAGQHDSFLDVVGTAAVLEHVKRVWASLFTDRAIAYRRRNGVDHRSVRMAVVVQRMVQARASGVLFTADPVTSNRKVTSVEAVLGLGDALVSGEVGADTCKVRADRILAREERHHRRALTDEQVLRLAALGRRVEARLGRPQDIEWCIDADGEVAVVQARPITTLFPIPAAGDDGNHVYVSTGHQQMMTDAMKPLGIAMRQMTAVVGMPEAGGRMFVDVTQRLANPATRDGLLKALGTSDPLIGDALRTIVAREGFLPPSPASMLPAGGPPAAAPAPIETDPAIVADLIARSRSSVERLEHDIRSLSGGALLDFIAADMEEMRRIVFDPLSMQAIMAGMDAAEWLNEHLEAWLGEKGAADTLTQSVPDNITSEMGLALLDVADAIRPYQDVVAFLAEVEDEDFLDHLGDLDGGPQARDAIGAFLDRYGMRCVGEIDITRPRWSERPSTLVPVLLSNVRNFTPGAGRRRFEEGLREARAKERDVLRRLRVLPDGEAKAREAKRMIDRLRTFSGYREYPKYAIVCRYLVYKRALLAAAARLVADGVLDDAEDVFFLTFAELQDVVRTNTVDPRVIANARAAYESYKSLTPPRVLTSEGEAVTGSYRQDDAPDGALPGLAVSAGTVEGRARVVLDLADADFEPGDILVTPFTDPSWTPAFVAIDGLVTEVGGLMTHGAVIAREYGLPAVVGVEGATRLIRDGRRIRVHGTSGYVELLD